MNQPISIWDLPADPLFHLIPSAFDDSCALSDEPARDLLSIYDALTGSHLCEMLPRPTRDPRRLLRGFRSTLKHVLYEAVEAGILEFERYELPWLFPAADEKPDQGKDASREQEDWIRILFFDSAGNTIPSDMDSWSATVDVVLSGGKEYPKVAFSRGRAEVASVPSGSPSACTVAFSGFHEGADVVPAKAAAVKTMSLATIDKQLVRMPLEEPKLVTRRELKEKQRAALGCTNVFQLRRRSVQVVELEHFAEDGALLWPGNAPADVQFRDGSSRTRGIDALRACLEFARDVALERIRVTGHGAKLSGDRANGVRALLVGDDDARGVWVDLAAAHGLVKDQQGVLQWASNEFNWDCDPEKIDNELGQKTRDAISAFQRRYNGDVAAGKFSRRYEELAVDGTVGPKTWAATFNCYQRALHGTASKDESTSLPAPGPRAIGCGAHHVKTPFAEVDKRRAVQRGVEVLVFEDGQAPETICTADSPEPCTAKSCELYDPREYDFVWYTHTFELTIDMVDSPWTEDDRLVILDEDDTIVFGCTLSDGKGTRSRRAFTFGNYVTGKKYRGEIRMKTRSYHLFDLSDISDVQSASSETVALESPSTGSSERAV